MTADRNEIIDLQRLQELKEILEDSFVELIKTFMMDAEKKIVDLKKSSDNKDYVEVKKIAHSLKGSSINVGAKYLSSLAEKIEEYCKKEDYAFIDETVLLINTHYPELKIIFQNKLD